MFIFQATFNSCIRTVRPTTEESFLQLCLQKQLSSVSKLKGISYVSTGLYTFFSKPVGGKVFDSFRKKARELQSYTDDTCWWVRWRCTLILHLFTFIWHSWFLFSCYYYSSKMLKRGTGLEDLFHHFESEALQREPPQQRASRLESARTIRLLHDKFTSDVSTFGWEKCMKTPPDDCPEPVCALYALKMLEDDKETDNSPLYGFGTELPNEAMKITPNLSLSRIFNILWLLPHFYSGIQSSYTYFANTHSYFPIHCEDSSLWGLNYMYLGHPKIWYVAVWLFYEHSHIRTALNVFLFQDNYTTWFCLMAWIKPEERFPNKWRKVLKHSWPQNFVSILVLVTKSLCTF